MIKIVGNDIIQNGQKIGWLSDNDIFNQSGEKVGYYTQNDIYNHRGVKIGYVEGSYIKTTSGATIEIAENRRHIIGGNYSEVCRAAIRLIFGD